MRLDTSPSLRWTLFARRNIHASMAFSDDALDLELRTIP
jgi:hypothetical protein